MERDPDYRYFNMDGQTIVLGDYLEIRPENEGRLRTLVQAGRIRIGPWYVMPDEFLVSGESLIRNLAKGIRIARSWGVEPLRCGYIPDIFGHNSQFPQIVSGFGIDNVVFFRGFGDCPTAELWWEGADGSRVLGLKLSEDRSYSDWFFAVRWPFSDRGFQYEPGELVERTKAFLEYKRKRATTDITIALDGVDHVEVEPRMPWILKMLNESDLGALFVHADLEQYINDLKSRVADLRVYRGEQRAPGDKGVSNNVLANTLSSRVHLKQMNHHCESLLEKWAEPWGVFAMLEGRTYPKAFLARAWEYLIQNHAHDSICGCSIDQVHQDMVGRFDQSRLISEQMIKEQLKFLSNHIDVGDAEGKFLLTVFNASQDSVDGVFEVELSLPAGTDAAIRHTLHGGASFKIYDHEANEVPYQLLEVERNRMQLHRWYGNIPGSAVVDRFRIAMKGPVPPFGYTSYVIETLVMEGPKHGEYSAERMSAPVRYPGSMTVDENTWDNGRLRLQVRQNGTVDVMDHQTGRTHAGLLLFEDEADVGDAWTHASPVTNEVCSTFGAHADISVVFDGPLQTRIRIRSTMRVPEEIQAGNARRSTSLTGLEITTDLDLRKDDAILRCRTHVKNNVRDHRLRVLFPTGLQTERFKTSTSFDLVERNVKNPDYSKYLEKFSGVVPHNGVIALDDGRSGLAIYSRGLYEAAVRDNEQRTIAMTLFRSIRKVVGMNDTDGGQLLGDLEFEYGIRPFASDGDAAGLLFREHQQFVGGVRSTQRPLEKVNFETPHRRTADLPLVRSFLHVDAPDLIVSAVKESEDRPGNCVVRLFNARSVPVKGAVAFDRALRSASLLDLNETAIADAPWDDRHVSVEVGPKQIVTLEVSF
ncbi:MAG: alpha-mannosidase [Sulfobacillus sp.]